MFQCRFRFALFAQGDPACEAFGAGKTVARGMAMAGCHRIGAGVVPLLEQFPDRERPFQPPAPRRGLGRLRRGIESCARRLEIAPAPVPTHEVEAESRLGSVRCGYSGDPLQRFRNGPWTRPSLKVDARPERDGVAGRQFEEQDEPVRAAIAPAVKMHADSGRPVCVGNPASVSPEELFLARGSRRQAEPASGDLPVHRPPVAALAQQVDMADAADRCGRRAPREPGQHSRVGDSAP